MQLELHVNVHPTHFFRNGLGVHQRHLGLERRESHEENKSRNPKKNC